MLETAALRESQCKLAAKEAAYLAGDAAVYAAVHQRWTTAELPAISEITDSYRVFTTSYFQLGFIPKSTFAERIANHEIDEFLILCVLALSARFTPSLVAKHGGGKEATNFFMQQALNLVPERMYTPNVENTQAFFLLSIAEWGNGERERSSIHMGVAVRMAAMLKLHREETYQLEAGATEEEVIEAEMGRRTFWMIQSQDNLHSGYESPAAFALDDITALLPCEESDFRFGINPHERAALQGTVPALKDSSLTSSSKRPLFATLIQVHSLWGQVARKVGRSSQSKVAPDTPCLFLSLEYRQIVQALNDFESQLPPQQKWSARNLGVWKDFGYELAYLSVVMMLRLSNIIVRRTYLQDVKECLTGHNVDDTTRNLWAGIADELFHAVEELYEQIEASFAMQSRKQAQAYPAILALPVYVCGSLSLNLWKCPALCPARAPRASQMIHRCLQAITELQLAWPMAASWQKGLQQAARPLNDDSLPTPGITQLDSRQAHTAQVPISPPIFRPEGIALGTSGLPRSEVQQGHYHMDPSFEFDTLTHEMFDAEVMAFLQGEAHFGFWDI
ncbi:hypothetical protein FKW77_004684 [Venturia effusa]|uniref:Xylanolytic transcriptional activator regulatory domain-containing protein n=1 Tax=Venturia effusa TaxID=50376 RepID=A0A517LCB2_9PEZI|nr:hypothetical protein FKW77_004684 [Venturia effusa]